MITDAIVSAVLGCLTALVSLFPAVTLPSYETAWGDPGSGVVAGAIQLNNVFPVFWVMVGLVAMLGLQLALAAWDVVVWVFHQFWGSD